MRSLIHAFFMHGKMKTTEAKAKEARVILERVIARARHPSLMTRRYLARIVPSSVIPKIFDFAKNQGAHGGAIRIVKLGQRKSDSASMALIELVR
ncbi:MAG: large subunit ribosomal protein L17 [Parcubacteria group bacterium Gr01-1014_66]|nr:MAG: large subunit ribosomal protein L17 [Parcubacteria group bacterium Gr01-1014_66]